MALPPVFEEGGPDGCVGGGAGIPRAAGNVEFRSGTSSLEGGLLEGDPGGPVLGLVGLPGGPVGDPAHLHLEAGTRQRVALQMADWRSLELARRARGTADRGRIRRIAGQAFALLVLSIRRGSKLATAMEARGFGASTRRTWARESRFGWPEVLLIAIGFVVAAAAVSAAILAGTWTFLGGQ